MKNDRQSMILEIISQENIETQEQLLTRLQERGINSTQATISRDIKQMHLIKEPAGHGVYKYAVSGQPDPVELCGKATDYFPGEYHQHCLRAEYCGSKDHARTGFRSCRGAGQHGYRLYGRVPGRR